MIKDKSDFIQQTIEGAKLYECEHLVTICENIINDMPELNPSIGIISKVKATAELMNSLGTWLNDEMGERAKKLFLNKELLSDVKFDVEGTQMYHFNANS